MGKDGLGCRVPKKRRRRHPAVDAYIQEMTSLGGRTRAANLTPKARQKIARSGGKAVWAGISPEERSRRDQNPAAASLGQILQIGMCEQSADA